jgi:hypothetical protein
MSRQESRPSRALDRHTLVKLNLRPRVGLVDPRNYEGRLFREPSVLMQSRLAYQELGFLLKTVREKVGLTFLFSSVRCAYITQQTRPGGVRPCAGLLTARLYAGMSPFAKLTR